MPTEPHNEQLQLETTIAALESQRGLLGDAVVDVSLGALRARLAALNPMGGAEPAQQLKQVTILFLDVVGSTTLSQHLDPEEIHGVMDDALARGTSVVQAHRGAVLQYAGDSLLAAFGAAAAQEDDAEQAVRCGLALLELGRALGAEVEARHGHAGFNLRVGIHTGAVLLGGGVDAEGSIRGIAVNIAARMEQTAPPGGLRISHETYTQIRGLFDVDVQQPLTVKGVDAPIQSYLVNHAKPRSFRIVTRGIEGVATKMIGREAELGALQQAFRLLYDAPVAERKLAAVTVVADAGIGKSRLLTEFAAWSEAQPESFYIFRGRATPQTQGQPFGLLRDILAWRFQIADHDTVPAARDKIEQGIVPLFLPDEGPEVAEGHAHLLGHLIGIAWRESPHIRGILDDPKQIRGRALHAAAQMFRRLSAADGTPIVLQLEDLHWADNESLDFLAELLEVNSDVAMLILAFCRPTLFERRPDWKRAWGMHRRIDLLALDPRSSRDLADELLTKLPEVPVALRELVIGGAEGNPFYMEELVKMLIDQGVIRTGGTTDGNWTVNTDRLLAARVPPTLTGVLQARLDRLPAPERQTLQQASVIGPVFWDQALFALDARSTTTLPTLVNRELTLPKAEAAPDGLREYAFHHHLLHQVTYHTVLKRTRRALHAKVAHWLSALGGLRGNDFLGAAAGHYEHAGDSANAAEFHARAAEHAKERFAHEAALAHVGRALALLDPPGKARVDGKDADRNPDAPLRWRLLAAREETLDLQARRDEQRSDIETLEQLADLLDDNQRRAYAAWRRSALASRTNDWTGSQAAACRGMEFAALAGDHGLRLNALRLLAWAHVNQNQRDTGEALARQGLTEAREHGLRANEASLHTTLAMIAAAKGDPAGAFELNRQGLRILRELGARRNVAVGLMNLGVGWLYLGDLARARPDLEEALRMFRSIGERHAQGNALNALSNLALWQGDDERALALARAALQVALAAQARLNEMMALLRVGDAESALGHHDSARLAYAQAGERALAIDSEYRHDATAGLARVALAQGDGAAALREVQTLLAHAAAAGPADFDRRVELTCHQVLTSAGDPGAPQWLCIAHEALQAEAATIPDAALRQGFLNNIPQHRAIVAAWAVRPDRLA